MTGFTAKWWLIALAGFLLPVLCVANPPKLSASAKKVVRNDCVWLMNQMAASPEGANTLWFQGLGFNSSPSLFDGFSAEPIERPLNELLNEFFVQQWQKGFSRRSEYAGGYRALSLRASADGTYYSILTQGKGTDRYRVLTVDMAQDTRETQDRVEKHRRWMSEVLGRSVGAGELTFPTGEFGANLLPPGPLSNQVLEYFRYVPIEPTAPPKTRSAEPTPTARDELRSMPGLAKVADQLDEIEHLLSIHADREAAGLKLVYPTLHARFEGNPGTGKTTVARLYARRLVELGFLKKRTIPAAGAKPRSEAAGASPETEIDAKYAAAWNQMKSEGEVPQHLLSEYENVVAAMAAYEKANANARALYDPGPTLAWVTALVRRQGTSLDPSELWGVIEDVRRNLEVGDQPVAVADLGTSQAGSFGGFFQTLLVNELANYQDYGPYEAVFGAMMAYNTSTPKSQRTQQGQIAWAMQSLSPGQYGNVRSRLAAIVETINRAKTAASVERALPPQKEPKPGSASLGEDSQEEEIPVIEVGGGDFEGPDAAKKMRDAIRDAQGGVLLIDELYAMNPLKNRFSAEAAQVLLKAMEDNRGDFVVIGTGYTKEMNDFAATNPGFARRFPQRIHFEDYDNATLTLILNKRAKDFDYEITPEAAHAAIQLLSRQRGPGFGNAGSVRNAFEAAVTRQATRLSKMPRPIANETHKRLTLEDFQGPPIAASAALARLEPILGHGEVKESILEIVSLLEMEKQRAALGQNLPRPLLNATFEGGPGTGKTTIAEIYGAILKDLGYLSDGEVIRVKASELIGTTVGDSEEKTRDFLRRAKGKVLFIDEAYQLFRVETGSSGNPYGQAVIDTLNAGINPDFNQDMVVILAGYTKEMVALMAANPGMARRFPRKFRFSDYQNDELAAILERKAKGMGFSIQPAAIRAAVRRLGLKRKENNFGNAGEVDIILGSALLRQSRRLQGLGQLVNLAQASEFTAEDLVAPLPPAAVLLEQLDRLHGLQSVKSEFHAISIDLELAQTASDPSEFFEPHYLFSGTAKTEMNVAAETLARLLHSQQMLPSDQLVTVTPADLLGEFTNHSAAKTQRALESALGKTIYFTDLGPLSDSRSAFNREVIETVAAFLRENRGRLAVVFAGTPEQAESMLAIPGLGHFVDRQIPFNDLTLDESMAIVVETLNGHGKQLSASGTAALRETIAQRLATPGWGNSQNVRDLARRVLSKNFTSKEAEIDEQGVRGALTPFSQRPAQTPPLQDNGPRQAMSPAAPLPPLLTVTKVRVEQAATAERAHALHDHDHAAIEVSPQTGKVLKALERVSQKEQMSEAALKKAIREGKLPAALLAKLAEEIGESKGQTKTDLVNAIEEAKTVVERLKELAKQDEKIQRLLKHTACAICGRADCNVMPYSWFLPE